MRDLVLREGLKTMAGDAALLLRDLLASGVEVPYEVRETGDGLPLAEYVPQTSAYIRDNASQLAALDSYGTTCAALESDGLATSYLEEMGVPVPADSRRRAELAGVVFLCRLWQGSTDFTLDDVKLTETIEELIDCGEVSFGEVEIAVPLRGFQMEVEKLELAGATIVRSDTVDVPPEARGMDGMGGAAWEPSFLVVARIDAIGAEDDESDVGIRAVAAFKHIVTTLRLFKAGGVALGPHAWVKAGGDRWRRVSTGAGRPRPGGYRLADTELGDLAALSRGLAHQSTPFARMTRGEGGFGSILSRAVSRFEAGLERPVTLEALNDYLLTLRFLLEGGGPASLSMSMRVASLTAEPDNRTAVKAVIDRAIALERELWSGEPAMGGDPHLPADVAAEVEDMTRAILRDASLGHLGTELRTTADEILLGDGLRVGEGTDADRGETAEWGAAMREAELADQLDASLVEESPFTEEGDPIDDYEPEEEQSAGSDPLSTELSHLETELGGLTPEESDAPKFVRAENKIHEHLAPGVDPAFEWSEPAPRTEREPDREPRFTLPERKPGVESQFGMRDEEPAFEPEPEPEGEVRILRAVPDDGPVAALIADSDNHRKEVASRVSFLFPPPETTEWSVNEVGYDRTRRAKVSDEDL
ncbi:MAG: hypothetical protein QOI31_6 [Solirubrobacterales bacterium]|jgi:hypothetical protein|nr:hypothetical protein [Solirubrobacterales bacterium]